MIKTNISSHDKFKKIWEEYRSGRHILKLERQSLWDNRIWYESKVGGFIISVFQSLHANEQGVYFFAVWKPSKAYCVNNAIIRLYHESLGKVFEFAQLWYLWSLAGETLNTASFEKKLK